MKLPTVKFSIPKFWNDPSVVVKTPFVTTLLLEAANVQQLWRMWTTHTAAGQSLTGWLSVNIALILWCNFYRVMNPKENRFALICTLAGVAMNAAVVLSVVYFRMTGRG